MALRGRAYRGRPRFFTVAMTLLVLDLEVPARQASRARPGWRRCGVGGVPGGMGEHQGRRDGSPVWLAHQQDRVVRPPDRGVPMATAAGVASGRWCEGLRSAPRRKRYTGAFRSTNDESLRGRPRMPYLTGMTRVLRRSDPLGSDFPARARPYREGYGCR